MLAPSIACKSRTCHLNASYALARADGLDVLSTVGHRLHTTLSPSVREVFDVSIHWSRQCCLPQMQACVYDCHHANACTIKLLHVRCRKQQCRIPCLMRMQQVLSVRGEQS